MAREYLRITPESTWGTYNSGGTHTIIPLDQSNAFSMRSKPIFWTIRIAGGYNRRWQRGSAKTGVTGNLNTLVYGSQAPVLVDWISASGTPLNNKSYTIDHGIVSEDPTSSLVLNRYLGALVTQATFTAAESDQLMRCNLDLVAQQKVQITATDFPEPAASVYPLDQPYVLEMAQGGFKWCDTGGSLISKPDFENFECVIKNMLDTRFFEGQFIRAYKWGGRDVDFKATYKYGYLIDRANFEALQTEAVKIVFSNGTGTVTQADVALGSGGSGYIAPKGAITGTGVGAVVEVVQSAGVVIGVKVVAGGYGYTGSPTLTITDSAGSGATATITLSTNHILTFDFQTNVFYDAVDDRLELDKVFVQGLGMNALLDPVSGNDFALSAT